MLFFVSIACYQIALLCGRFAFFCLSINLFVSAACHVEKNSMTQQLFSKRLISKAVAVEEKLRTPAPIFIQVPSAFVRTTSTQDNAQGGSNSADENSESVPSEARVSDASTQQQQLVRHGSMPPPASPLPNDENVTMPEPVQAAPVVDDKKKFAVDTSQIKEPIHRACLEGNSFAVQQFLNQDKKLLNRACELDKWTPLHVAAFARQIEVCKVLVENGAEMDSLSSIEATPLHLACSKGYSDIVEYLISKGAGTIVVMLTILDINKRDGYGNSVLYLCIKTGHLKLADELISLYNVDVNSKTSQGKTALFAACEQNKLDIVQWLLEKHQAQCNIKDQKGNTPLFAAISKSAMDVVQYLASKDFGNTPQTCNFKLFNGQGKNVLHIMAEFNQAAIMAMVQVMKPKLLEAMLNEPDKAMKRTPIHYAVDNGHVDAINYLLQMGADPNLKDETGQTRMTQVCSHLLL